MFCITGLVLLRCGLEPMNVAGGASGTDLSACVVSGNVVDSSGNPVAGAVVYLRQAGFRNHPCFPKRQMDRMRHPNGCQRKLSFQIDRYGQLFD